MRAKEVLNEKKSTIKRKWKRKLELHTVSMINLWSQIERENKTENILQNNYTHTPDYEKKFMVFFNSQNWDWYFMFFLWF